MNDKLESYIHKIIRITQNQSEIKTLSDKQKLREHDKSRLLLNKIIKDILQTRGKWSQMEGWRLQEVTKWNANGNYEVKHKHWLIKQ